MWNVRRIELTTCRLADAIKLHQAIAAASRYREVIPCLRSRGRAVRDPGVLRNDRAAGAGGTIDVLLPDVPALLTADSEPERVLSIWARQVDVEADRASHAGRLPHRD